ncbi:MAG: hypothetical protein UY47_C0004G0039 [Parcubacteria group bacterium GW2011_GWB1_49_7]|nr:MAG: hypothetical protein UX71_C0002G0073 [Parcubacteria group bacterium GW2011_GWA1_47_10]KKW09865.1 MAG: hypothetical protein UY47_C0004G0039 [Parcubacteria group bacterium GW2011_GWB1_49_7]
MANINVGGLGRGRPVCFTEYNITKRPLAYIVWMKEGLKAEEERSRMVYFERSRKVGFVEGMGVWEMFTKIGLWSNLIVYGFA